MGHLHGHGSGASPVEGPERLRSVRIALAVSVALFAAKLLAYLATGFVVLLAEALHSLTDALQTGLLLVAARLSAMPPDEAHPFGHGRGENLAAIVASLVVVFLVATELVREAWGALTVPREAPEQPGLALLVLLGSALLMLWPLLLARRDMHAAGGVVKAQAMESLNDLLGVLAAVVGIVAVMAGFPLGDAVAALAVAGIIVWNAIQLFRANVPYVIGGSPPHAFYERVERVALQEQGALGVHAMAAEYVGPSQVHLDLHLTVRADMTIHEADQLAHRVRDRIEHEVREVSHATIHFCATSGELRRVGRDPEGRAQPPQGAHGAPARRGGEGPPPLA